MTAKSLAQTIRKGGVAPLSVALSQAFDITVLVPFVIELVRALPGLEMRFLRGPGCDVAEHLKKGDAEVAIGGPIGETWDRLDVWPLFREPYLVVLPAAHALAHRSSITIADLAKERFVCRSHCEHLGELSAILKAGGVDVDAAHKVGSEHDVLELVRAGIGAGLMPQSSVQSEGVRMLPLDGLGTVREVSVYAVAGRPRSTAGSTLIKMLRASDWGAKDLRSAA
jgi:DNA-binding transcriptional LysR family regulator